VGTVVGVAFATVVQALVKDLLTPLIAANFGQPDFGALTFRSNRSVFRYGRDQPPARLGPTTSNSTPQPRRRTPRR
jgi:hypothetical protein